MKRKILLYGDLTLNIVDGSSVWLVSLAKLLSLDKDNIIDILLKEKAQNDILTKDLYDLDNVNFIEANCYTPKYSYINSDNVEEVIKLVDEYRDYSCIIVRGFKVVNILAKNKKIAEKLIPYLTDFEHDKEKISDVEKEQLKNIYDNVKQFFTQTVQMKDYLKDILNVDGEKFKILSPMIFKDEIKTREVKHKSIVYAGKIALNWNILELIDIMDRIYEKDKEITLHFIGDKFNRDLAGRKDEIINKLKSMPNVVFYGSLPKKETTEIINSCELGYSFRSTNIDNEKSLELSSKILEYCFCNIPVLLRRTKIHENILGTEYPLYVESIDDCVDKIIDFFNNKSKYQNVKENLSSLVTKFSPDNIYKNIFSALEAYPKKKLRLLITGHDLKFIKDLYPYLEENYDLTIQQYDEYMDINIKESEKLLLKTDIVWCEWLLLNAEWYSKNILPHQKIYIRAHRFELNRKYGFNVKWDKISKLITVSYFYMEQFIEKFNIPREKVTVINNFINSKNYSIEKNDGYKYNIAMIGILPKRKGFDRAVDLLINLKEKNKAYKLYIAGKRPEEFPNTWCVPEERQYYEKVYKKIEENNLTDSVIFTGWIKIPDFLKDIGYVLSLSDKEFPESFHISPFEGMVSNGIGLALKWDGIEYIYPQNIIYDNIYQIAEKIEYYNNNEEEFKQIAENSRNFTIENYDINIIANTINKLLDGKIN